MATYHPSRKLSKLDKLDMQNNTAEVHTNNSTEHQSFIYTQLNVKTVLFQIIQFSISTLFSSI